MVPIILFLIYLSSGIHFSSPAALITSRKAKFGNYNLVWNFIFPDNMTHFYPNLNQQDPNENIDIEKIDADAPIDDEGLAKMIYSNADASTSIPSPAVVCQKPQVPDPEIYWKVFKSPPVPKEAFLVGLSSSGTSIHIGQVYVPFKDAGLQPVAIYNNSAYVESTYSKNRSSNKNIKILCTTVPPEKIEDFLTWIPSDFAWKLNPESDLVITGVERDSYSYSGKAMYSGGLRVGKASRHNKGFSLFFPLNGKEVWLGKDFYVLAYKHAVDKF